MSTRSLLALVPLIACLTACPESRPEPKVPHERPGTDVVAASEYCEHAAEVLCPFYLRCGRMDVSTEAECRSVFQASCESRYEPRWTALADGGALRLSRRGLEMCASHLRDVTCEQQQFDLQGPCAHIWQGLVPEGGSCGPDFESFVCRQGNTCVLDTSLCGTCMPTLPVEASCADHAAQCGADAICSDVEGQKVCTRRAIAGETCGDGGARCVAGTRCVDERCIAPTFVKRGDPCDRDHRCPYLTQCLQEVCMPLAKAGMPCDADTPCEAGQCKEGICTPLLEEGQSCSNDGECISGHCAENRCAALVSKCLLPQAL